jgi:hypothetical protein
MDNWIRKEELLLCGLLLSTVSECACIFFLWRNNQTCAQATTLLWFVDYAVRHTHITVGLL